MPWKNPFRRKPKEAKRVKPIQESDVKAKGRKAFEKYRQLMEEYRSLQERSQTKSKLLKSFSQWLLTRKMQYTNRKLQRAAERALALNAEYRKQGGREIFIPKSEHMQLVGGVPPAAIHEIIRAKEQAHARIPLQLERKVELHRPAMLRNKLASAAAQTTSPSNSTSARHPVKQETKKKIRARLESLYQEFRSDPKANKAGVQRAFRTIADYVKTLKSEEAHAQFDTRVRNVVKLLNDGKRVEAAHAVSALSKTIRTRMQLRAPAPASRPASAPAERSILSPARKAASPSPEKPIPFPRKEKSGYEEEADATLEAAKKKKKEKKSPESINPIQGVATTETAQAAEKTSLAIIKILREAEVEARLRKAGNSSARAQVADVLAKSMIIYSPTTQTELLRLAHKLKTELARDDVGNANNTLQEMAEIAQKVKFKKYEE